MNNYYALIYLTEHINTKLRGSRFINGGSPHKNVWEGHFEHKDEEIRLLLSTTPGETALFTDRYRPLKKRNMQNFFEPLYGARVTGAELAEGDRLLTLSFNREEQLLFQLFGNRANLFMTDGQTILESFKNPKKRVGTPPPEPRKPAPPGQPEQTENSEKLLLHFDQKLPRHLIRPLVEQFDLDSIPPGNRRAERAEEIVKSVVNAMMTCPEFRILANGHLCLIPTRLLPLENSATFDSVNEAIRHGYYEASALRRYSQQLKEYQESIHQSIRRGEKALKQLESADKALRRAETHEQYGHLLMAAAHREVDPGTQSIELENFYDENRPVIIQLKPSKDIAENARDYYNRAAKAKRRVQQAETRRKELTRQLQELEELRKSLQSTTDLHQLREWEKKQNSALERHRLLPGSTRQSSSPWKTTHILDFEVRIGKNAKSNDKLTRTAHKEDIWLHARGTSGSHVVIRMENQTDYPPENVLYRAAGYAAWHSKLRGSALVPVISTKRKYITKPKGAPAGTVRVSREEVLMVEPVEPTE
ncbi:MAG: NFACT RNA binding domain-containing protein [Balneolaceae bacterium]